MPCHLPDAAVLASLSQAWKVALTRLRPLEGPQKAVKEIPAVLRYDYVVLNYDLEQAAEEIRSIIVAERVRVGKCDCDRLVRVSRRNRAICREHA